MSPTATKTKNGSLVVASSSESWSYREAFKRNRGLIDESEQERLRNSRIAIAGMGGVGGVHLATLARLGVGKFTLADPDVFEVANFNRQYGAKLSNLGRNKAEAMGEEALDINPELDLRIMPEAVDQHNMDAFLDDADLFVDGLDFFAIEARRSLFRRAAERKIWALTAGPIGFSVAWLTFDPAGMSFDRYFDLSDRMSRLEQLAAFAVGLAPAATHRIYTDLRYASVEAQTGPSAALACQLASGALAADAVSILCKRNVVKPVPYAQQFDAYRGVLRRRHLSQGNRGLLQRLKRRYLVRRFSQQA